MKSPQTTLHQQPWGIIYCPKVGTRHSYKRWEAIRRCLEARHLVYDFVQSDGPGSVERLTSMLVRNGYTTIIIVGGDEALGQALNAIMAEEPTIRGKVALGIIPNGITNDYAHFWDLTEDDIEHSIDVLAAHKLRRVDTGYCQWKNDQEGKQCRYFLNCLNIGIVAHIVDLKNKAPRFQSLSLFTRPLHRLSILFKQYTQHTQVKLSHQSIEGRVLALCIGNAHGYGQTPSAVPYNGMLDVSVFPNTSPLEMIHAVWMLIMGRFINHPHVQSYRTRETVHVALSQQACMGMDGLVVDDKVLELHVNVLPESLSLIVP